MVDIPGNNTSTVELAADGGSLTGDLEVAGDHDWIRVTLNEGFEYVFYLSFLVSGSQLTGDAFLTLRDAAGGQVLSDDDGGPGVNSFLSFTPGVGAGGTYFVDVGELGDNDVGSWGLFVSSAPANERQLTDNDDTYTGLSGERVVGGKGNDQIDIGAGWDGVGEQGNDTIFGNESANFISGGLGDDVLLGFGDADTLFGDAGNDALQGGEGSDVLYGGPGQDQLTGGTGPDVLFGGDDPDLFFVSGSEGVGDTFDGGGDFDSLFVSSPTLATTLSGFNATASEIESWEGNGKGLFGTSAANVFNFDGLVAKNGMPFVDGKGGNDTIIGSNFADALLGGSGKDTLKGGLGKDTLTGGSHRDLLYGGADRDKFDFNRLSETKPGSQRDKILDLKHGQDDIDLRTIDAKTGVSGNQKFKFIGKGEFHDVKGELRYEDLGSKVIVQGDVNGDSKADFEIYVKVGGLSSGDFLL